MVSADSRPTAIDDLQPQKSWSEHPYFIYCCMNKLCNMRFMRNTVNYSPLLWRLNPSSVRKLWWLVPLSDNDFTGSVCSSRQWFYTDFWGIITIYNRALLVILLPLRFTGVVCVYRHQQDWSVKRWEEGNNVRDKVSSIPWDILRIKTQTWT